MPPVNDKVEQKDKLAEWDYLVFEELEFAVLWKANGEYWVDYEIYKILGKGDIKGGWRANGCMLFKDAGDMGAPTDDINKAELFAKGNVKWDGCSNWDFTDGGFHFCSRKQFVNLAAVLAACWDHTREALPNFQGE